ncbi:hypothetical protein KY285_015212 [Solanum tuberosum]|nr:hypothetical protein KY285_015212 [Solanum tuberosum]
MLLNFSHNLILGTNGLAHTMEDISMMGTGMHSHYHTTQGCMLPPMGLIQCMALTGNKNGLLDMKLLGVMYELHIYSFEGGKASTSSDSASIGCACDLAILQDKITFSSSPSTFRNT